MREFYDLSDSQFSIVERAASIAREVIAPAAEANDRAGTFPRAAIDALGKAGLLGLTVPKEFGGLGEGPRTFAAVVETIAKADASAGMVFVMHVCATNVIAAHPPKRGGAEILKAIAAGKHVSTLAFSEKGSRSHFWAPISREKVAGGKRTIDADKSFATSAGEADSYVVSTLAADGKTPVESSLYLVLKGKPGFTVAGKFDGLGLRGNASAPMSLRGVEVDEQDLVTKPSGGFDAMMGIVLPWFQAGSAAVSVGIAEAAFIATAGHLTNSRFEHLGEALSSLPNLRAQTAVMRMELDRSRAQLAYTARALEAPGPHTMPAVLASKAQAADMALAVTDLAMRSCGGVAFSKHLTIERNFRDSRAASIMAPTTDQLRDFLGKALLGLPLF